MGVSSNSIRQFAARVQCFRVPAAVFHPLRRSKDGGRQKNAGKILCPGNTLQSRFGPLSQPGARLNAGASIIAGKGAAFRSAFYSNGFPEFRDFLHDTAAGCRHSPCASKTPLPPPSAGRFPEQIAAL